VNFKFNIPRRQYPDKIYNWTFKFSNWTPLDMFRQLNQLMY